MIEKDRVARAALAAACKQHAAAENAFGVGSKHPRITEAESAMDRAGDALEDTAAALANVEPTTMAGLLALIDYALNGDTDGEAWPDLESDDDGRLRHWYFFCLQNVSGALRNLGVAA
ncbi:hypothetical protein XH87_12230 [Bradyrhizobium sp. CCBAU 53415]|nr:hypothetical protein [Bradyrhizobium sp. CCBAU 53415]